MQTIKLFSGAVAGNLALLVIALKLFISLLIIWAVTVFCFIMSYLEDTYTFSFSEKLYNFKTYGSNLKPYTEVDVELNPSGYEIHPLLLDQLQ